MKNAVIKHRKQYFFCFKFISFSISVGFCKLQIAKFGDDLGLLSE